MRRRAPVRICLARLAFLAALVPAAAYGATWTAFGPETVLRSTDMPTPVTRTFSVLNPNAVLNTMRERHAYRDASDSRESFGCSGHAHRAPALTKPAF